MLQLMMRVKCGPRGSEVAAGFTEAKQQPIGALDTREPQSAKFGNGLKVFAFGETLQFSRPELGLDSPPSPALSWRDGASLEDSPRQRGIGVGLGKHVAF
jgi:hypothetical protein